MYPVTGVLVLQLQNMDTKKVPTRLTIPSELGTHLIEYHLQIHTGIKLSLKIRRKELN